MFGCLEKTECLLNEIKTEREEFLWKDEEFEERDGIQKIWVQFTRIRIESFKNGKNSNRTQSNDRILVQ